MEQQQKLEAVLRSQGVQRCLWESVLAVLADGDRQAIAAAVEEVDGRPVVTPAAAERLQAARLAHERRVREKRQKDQPAEQQRQSRDETRPREETAAPAQAPAIDDPLEL